MRTKTVCIWIFLALLGSAASANANCTLPGDPPSDPVTDTCISASDAATSWRYLATRSGGAACPTATGWIGGKLFGNGPLPPGLDAYCGYEAVDQSSAVTALSALLCTADSPPNCLNELEADLLALTYLATQAVEGLVVNELHQQFLRHSGAIGPLTSGPQRVRLAVIDTEPTGIDEDRNGPGIADHGFTLLNLQRGLMCPEVGPCSVQLTSRLGLPLQLCSTEPGASCPCNAVPASGVCRNAAAGGYVGTISDLARAVWREVNDWQSSGVNRLVINLSVGWESRYSGVTPLVNPNLASRTVLAALEHASCRGALVLAATGNRVPGPEAVTGPVYPAAWETVIAPNAQQCQAMLGEPPDPTLFPVPDGVYRPLVYAAAAIDHAGEPVETRPDGESRLSAFGDHAVTLADYNGISEPTSTLTGSSVAAAVVSAAAAAAWHFRPAQPSYAIMQAIYQNAGNVGRTADFCLGGTCGAEPVRQVKACEAVDAACRFFPGPVCPDHNCPIDIPVSAPLPAQDLLNAFASDPVTDVSTFGFTAAVPDCGVGYTLHWESGTTMPANPCPHRQYYGIQANSWADSQVTDQACELCTIGYASPGTLFIEIKDEFGQTLEDLTLICGTNAFRLPGSLLPGERRLVTGIPAACEFENVDVAFRFTRDGIDSTSVVSPTLRIADRDGDGVQDALDNCYDDANPLQIDADSDSIGNRCDGDFNNDCIVNAFDLGILRSVFFSSDPIVDLSEDGIVNVADLGIFKRQFFQPPGPSGIANVCTP